MNLICLQQLLIRPGSTAIHNTTQNSSDDLSSYPPRDHHCSKRLEKNTLTNRIRFLGRPKSEQNNLNTCADNLTAKSFNNTGVARRVKDEPKQSHEKECQQIRLIDQIITQNGTRQKRSYREQFYLSKCRGLLHQVQGPNRFVRKNSRTFPGLLSLIHI